MENFYSANGNQGNFDFQIVGDKLFTLSTRNVTARNITALVTGVSIFDVEGEIQDFQTILVDGIDANAQCMAVYT